MTTTSATGPAQSVHASDSLVHNLPDTENKKFYPALNGLRGVAILLVFFQHYIIWSPVWAQWGWTGVDIFFVLSGFLITGILYDTRNAKNRFKNFYGRRTLRIFPLYYAVLVFAIITSPVFHWVWERAWFLWFVYLGNFTIFQAHREHAILLTSATHPFFHLHFGHFWTLCVEEQFYLVWPPIVYLVKDRVKLRNLCLAFVCAAPLLRLACTFLLRRELLNADFLYVFTPLRADALILGGLLALCLRGPEAARIARLAVPFMLGILGAFALGQIVSMIINGRPLSTLTGTVWIETFGYSVIDMFAASIIIQSLNEKTVFFKLFNAVWLKRVGEMSYGLYIFHQLFYDVYQIIPKLIFGRNVGHIIILHALTSFICTPILAYLSYRFFESKFLRLKERFVD